MRGYVADAVAPTRFTLLLIAVFAVVALLLASVGLYGVVSYSVRQRTNELGIRLALGAQEGTLVRSIVGDGLVLTGIGLFVGLALAVPTSRLLSTILFGVRPTDIATYVVVSLTLAAVALLATYLPARAVGKLDPVRALRAE